MPKHTQTLELAAFSTFGALLKALRERAGLTQREMAQRVGYHYSYISRLEKNERLPDEAAVKNLFIPALKLDPASSISKRLLEFASVSLPDLENKLPYPGANFPATLTSFLGRESEAHILGKLLLQKDTHLITLIGPPGVGKTRLALYAANLHRQEFQDDAVFVDLSSIQESHQVLPALLAALGIQETRTSTLLDSAIAFLSKKNILIVMDNFEQVLDSAPQLLTILGNAPAVKILCTSREALRVNGEWEFLLKPLAVPNVESHSSLLDFPSVQLFLQRAIAANPSFQFTDENASFVADICRRLDGLPLAIELAAARTRSLSPHLMIEQFDRRFDWLATAGRDLPPWRQTLRGAIEWSYALLDGQERALFCRLSVFQGSWLLAAAEEVCSDEVLCPSSEILRISLQLVDKSLLVLDPISGRYHFLETLREYASDNFQSINGFEEYIRRYSHYYARYVIHSLPKVVDPDWLNQIDAELNNIRASLSYFIKSNCFTEAAETTLAMSRFWDKRAYFTEARRWLETVVAMEIDPTLLRARLLQNLGAYYRVQGEYQLSEEVSEASKVLFESFGDEAGVNFALDNLAILAGIKGDYPRTIELLERVVTYRRNSEDIAGLTTSLNNLAIANRRMGNLQRATELYSEVIAVTERIGNLRSLGHALYGLSEVYKDMENYPLALELAVRSLSIRHQFGDKKGVAFSLGAIAIIKHHLGSSDIAAQIESAARKIRYDIKSVPSPVAQAEMEAFHVQLRESLGELAFNQHWNYGESLSIEQALALLIT